MKEKPVEQLRQLPDGKFASYSEGNCPGHVAHPDNRKVCGLCGAHVDELRPPESDGI